MLDGNDAKLDELDRLLNDPEVPMEAARVWEILAEVSGRTAADGHLAGGTRS